MTTKTLEQLAYKVADISLADFGRKEIEIAEKENARADGSQTKICCRKTTERRPYHRVAAHDHSNCCAH